jgi:hypothetical protein
MGFGSCSILLKAATATVSQYTGDSRRLQKKWLGRGHEADWIGPKETQLGVMESFLHKEWCNNIFNSRSLESAPVFRATIKPAY